MGISTFCIQKCTGCTILASFDLSFATCLAVVTFLGSHYLFTHIPCEANVKPALFYSENIDSNIDCTSQLLNVITLFAKLPFRFVLSCHDVI